MISENGDDKKTQKSRSVPILSSPATALREHIPSEVSISSNYPCDMKHGLETRFIGGKYQHFNSQVVNQDDLISGTDTSSSEIYGKSPCFVLPKKRRKSNRDNHWPTYEQNHPIMEENTINESVRKPSLASSSKSSLQIRSSGFFVPNWSAAGEEYVDDLESSSDFRDENDYSQDEDPTIKNEIAEVSDDLLRPKSEEKINLANSENEGTENERQDANGGDTTGDEELQTPTYEQNFEHFMTVCEEELLENETFPKLWASDLSCTEEHGVLSSSHKTSECLEGSKASLCLDGIGFIEDDVEMQLATAADDVVQTIIKEETQAVSDSEQTPQNESKLPTVICSHMVVEQRQQEVESKADDVKNTSEDDFFDASELYEQLERDVQEGAIDKSFSQDNVLTPSEECIIKMCDNEIDVESERGKIKSSHLMNVSKEIIESLKPEHQKSDEDMYEKGVLTISLEKLHLERKRNGSFCHVNNLYTLEKPEAFENYMDSDDGGCSSQNNTSGMEEVFSPCRDDYYTTEKACQMTPRVPSGGKVQSISEDNFKSPDGEEKYFVPFVEDRNRNNNNQQQISDDDTEEKHLNKQFYSFASRGIGSYCTMQSQSGEKTPMLLCDDIRLLKQKRNIRPHSASTNRDTLPEGSIWTMQQMNEFNKRPKTTPKSFLIDKTCGEVRSDECLSSASIISPSGVSENVDVESPSWSNESVNKYREFAKMRKRELLARFVAERKHREELDQLLAQLHDSYDKLLAKHAEAENTIDQLRLGKPMKLENLRLSPSMNYSLVESHVASVDCVKSLPSYPISPRVLSTPSVKEMPKRHNLMLDVNLPMQFGGFTSNRRVADSFCQTDFCPESVNEPFCSSVASFLLRANCLLDQVNSLHECMIEGINIEPNVTLQMLSYLWESYLSLQHDVQAHVGHTAALEKIALEDVRNLLSKIHSQLVAIETHHASVSWKGLLPFVEKKPDTKNFSFLRETSSYGSLPTSPTASSNSQRSESRDNFSLAEIDSGCLSADKSDLKACIKRTISKQTDTDENHLQPDSSDYLNTVHLDKVESKSSNESECIEVVKTLLRAIHSEEIQSTLKQKTHHLEIKGKPMAASISETQSSPSKRTRKDGHVKPSDLDAIFVLCEDKSIYRTVERDAYPEDNSPRMNEDGMDETIDISCKSNRTNKDKGDFQFMSGEMVDERVGTKSTPTSDRFDTSDKMSSTETEPREVEHQETLNLLATLDAEQRKILEETLKFLSTSKNYCGFSESQATTVRSMTTIKEAEENEVTTIRTELSEQAQAESNDMEMTTKAKNMNTFKKDIFLRMLDEMKNRVSMHFNEAINEAEQSEGEWDIKDNESKKGMSDIERESEVGSMITDVNSEHIEPNPNNDEEEVNIEEETGAVPGKASANGLSESSEFSTESFSEVNSDLAGYEPCRDKEDKTSPGSEDQHTTYVYVKSDNEEKTDGAMLEQLNKQIQQLRYEVLERGLHGEDIYHKSKTQASQTENEKAKSEISKDSGEPIQATSIQEDRSVKIRNGETILHCCGIHHLVRQKKPEREPILKPMAEEVEEDKLPRCPYCHQLIGHLNEPKGLTLTSSVSSDLLAESEDLQSSIPITTPGLNNDDDYSVQKCSSFTGSDSTTMDTTTLITAVCNCMEETTAQGNKTSSQVREVFFAMLECDGYGTKECFAAVETSNTLKSGGGATIESVSSHENQSVVSINDDQINLRIEEKPADFWEKSEGDFWYDYPESNEFKPVELLPKIISELKSGSPPTSEEQSWSSHRWLHQYQEQLNQTEYKTIDNRIENIKETTQDVATETLQQTTTEIDAGFDEPVVNEVQQTDITVNSCIQTLHARRSESPILTSMSDLSATSADNRRSSNIRSPETTETSLTSSSSFTGEQKIREDLTKSQSVISSNCSLHQPEQTQLTEPQSVDIEELYSEISISAGKMNDEETTMIEDEFSVADDNLITESQDFVKLESRSLSQKEIILTQLDVYLNWSSIGVQVEPSQQDAHIQAWPSLKDRDTQMTASAESSQDTDADATSIISTKEHTDQEESEKCSTLDGKFSAHSLVLMRKTDNDSTETDEIISGKRGSYQPVSDSEIPKSRRHQRKMSKRSGSHSCSLQSTQNDNHQSCKSCARLLRKTEALATTMLKELKGHPVTSESSDENVEMKKLQLIHALDLANKIAKRLKHHSVQMLQSLTPGASVSHGSTV